MGLYLHKDIQKAREDEHDTMVRQMEEQRETFRIEANRACVADVQWLAESRDECGRALSARRQKANACLTDTNVDDPSSTISAKRSQLKALQDQTNRLKMVRDGVKQQMGICTQKVHTKAKEILSEGGSLQRCEAHVLGELKRWETETVEANVRTICDGANETMKGSDLGYALWKDNACHVFARVPATSAPTEKSNYMEQYADEEACARHFKSGKYNSLLMVHTDDQKTGCVFLNTKAGKADVSLIKNEKERPKEDRWLLNHRALENNALDGVHTLQHVAAVGNKAQLQTLANKVAAFEKTGYTPKRDELLRRQDHADAIGATQVDAIRGQTSDSSHGDDDTAIVAPTAPPTQLQQQLQPSSRCDMVKSALYTQITACRARIGQTARTLRVCRNTASKNKLSLEHDRKETNAEQQALRTETQNMHRTLARCNAALRGTFERGDGPTNALKVPHEALETCNATQQTYRRGEFLTSLRQVRKGVCTGIGDALTSNALGKTTWEDTDLGTCAVAAL